MTKDKNFDTKTQVLPNIQPIVSSMDVFIRSCTTDSKPRISTGIWEFDRILNGGLSDEFYIMGAETSTGKSAFLMFIAQKIAESGIDALYFALEMGQSEFIARGISAISFEEHQQDKEKCVTASDILYWTWNPELKNFIKMELSKYKDYADEYFRRYGDHLYIIESGLRGLSAKDIANIATAHKQKTRKPVVVFIDYLQLLKADPKDPSQTDRKTKIDRSAVILKTLASQIGMPVVTISSISRNNYNEKINTSSFKESGDLEYTGGVLLGWDWCGVTDVNRNNIEEITSEKVSCKQRGYRRMRLSLLKYRNAEKDNEVLLRYYPAYNYFASALKPDISTAETMKYTTGDRPKGIPGKVMSF